MAIPEDCIENANSAAYDWIYVELSEFDGQLPAVTDITDIPLKDGDIAGTFPFRRQGSPTGGTNKTRRSHVQNR